MSRDPFRSLDRFVRKYGLYLFCFAVGVFVDRLAAKAPVIGICP